MRLSLQNTSDHVKVESNNKLLLHYLCIILTLNMLTKGMIDVKFPFSLSVPQDIMGCMFTLADIIQQLSSFELYFSGFAMSFLAIFIFFYTKHVGFFHHFLPRQQS